MTSTINVQTFASRFQAMSRSLETAIGDAKVANLATLAIVTNGPLLVEAQTSQESLARAMASVMGGTFDKTMGFNAVDLVADLERANVFYADGIDNLYAKGMATIFSWMAEKAAGRVFVLVSRIGHQGVRAASPEAVIDRHTLFVKGEFDSENVTDAQAVVTIAEVLEMRAFAEQQVEVPDTVVEFLVDLKRGCAGELAKGEEIDLFDYLSDPPSMRGFIQITDVIRALAASQGRVAVSHADVRSIGEVALSHRFRPSSISPYTRFALGRRIVQHTLGSLPDRTTATTEEGDSLLD